jgi:hypothetical protein
MALETSTCLSSKTCRRIANAILPFLPDNMVYPSAYSSSICPSGRPGYLMCDCPAKQNVPWRLLPFLVCSSFYPQYLAQ